MAKTRDIRRRITSVRTIRKITHTMERVAQSKTMKLTGRYDHARGFRSDLLRLLPESLGEPAGSPRVTEMVLRHPLAAPRPEPKSILLVCVTSSRGLCGGYNVHVLQAVETRIAELTLEERQTRLAVLGRKGLAYMRYHDRPVAIPVPELDENIGFDRIGSLAGKLIGLYRDGTAGAIEIVSTRLRTRAHHEVACSPFLPLTLELARQPATAAPEPYNPLSLVEPGRAVVLDAILPLLLQVELYCLVLEAMLCEQAQRTLAMRSASDNADEMTRRLTRTYNRARQAQITSEMIEIVGGGEGGRS